MVDKGGESIYRFDDFTLEPRDRCLRKDGQEIYLRPKAFQTLLYLVDKCGHLVSKDELLDQIWAGTIVTDTAMTHCINEARKSLGDDAHQPRYIKTIPGSGYKFIAPVSKVHTTEEEIIEEEFVTMKVTMADQDQKFPVDLNTDKLTDGPLASLFQSPRRFPAHSLAYLARFSRKIILFAGILVVLIFSGLFFYDLIHPDIQSLAVLPLTNLNADSSQDYFDDGMTEALITELAKISSVRVISRTSVMQYKRVHRPLREIAQELDVDAVVEGSLFYSGDRVRINVQLLQVRPERHLWAESYEREMIDILKLQNEVTKSIADEIKANLTPSEHAHLTQTRQVYPEAYQSYLKGRYFWNKRTPEGFHKGIDFFEKAIDLDPTYAKAYAGLADCYNGLYDFDLLAPADAAPKAKSAAMKALAIDSTLADAYTSLGFVTARYDWEWLGAERNFQRAIELNKNYSISHHWYALHLAMMGRFDNAMAEIKKALDLDPLSLIVNANVAWIHYFAGQYDEAEQQLKKTVAMNSDFLSAHVKLAWVYEQQAKYEQAIDQFYIALALSGDDANVLALLGSCYALAGKTNESKKIIYQLTATSKQRYISPYWIAMIYACLGDKDNAFHWLNQAVKERSGSLVWIKVEPKLDRLRSDPRFAEFITTIGLR